MREEINRYVHDAYAIVCHAANVIGPRLPGSANEKKFADYMEAKMQNIGLKTHKEPFAVSPRSSIGGVPTIGWISVVVSLMMYPARIWPFLWFPITFFVCLSWVWIIGCVFLYHRWFDKLFRQEKSQNVYGELLPEDGKYDYTIILSGHTDTSWNWKHSEHTYYNRKNNIWRGIIPIYCKVGFSAVCYVAASLISIFMTMLHSGFFSWCKPVFASHFFYYFGLIMLVLPAVTAIGSAFLIQWNDPKEEVASPGAMDDATGVALAYTVTEYFRDHPEKMPKNCRIIAMGTGSEEAGLRGSMAFTREHKGEEILQNAWNINIDSIADEGYFEVVIKDDWQFTRFDKDMEQMFKDTFKELNIESVTGGCIHNPVGGCDSTPMTRAGVKSVTFAAQNPVLTYYYHTFRDRPERFTPETVGKGFEVILGVIDKIGKFQEEHGYNGVNH